MDGTDVNLSPLACDMSAIPPEKREAHERLGRRLFEEAALDRQELEDGYAFRFGGEEYDALAAFIANERRCCPFYRFTLDVSPEQGPIWLRMTGREGAKALLASGVDFARASNPGEAWPGFLPSPGVSSHNS